MIFHTNFKTVLFLTLIITIGSMNYGILAGTQDESALHKYSGVFNGSEAGGMPVANDMEMMIDLLEKPELIPHMVRMEDQFFPWWTYP
jgi:hypothetical protein